MRVTIDDLEALKELNDELEENHVEAENQLSEEVGKLRLSQACNEVIAQIGTTRRGPRATP